MRIIYIISLLCTIGCGMADKNDDGLSNAPGGAYSAELSLEFDDCEATKPEYREWVWADAWPKGDSNYYIDFWKFDWPEAHLFSGGQLKYRKEETYWPKLYEVISDGNIFNKRIDLKTTVNEYSLDVDDNRTFLCKRVFELHGTK